MGQNTPTTYDFYFGDNSRYLGTSECQIKNNTLNALIFIKPIPLALIITQLYQGYSLEMKTKLLSTLNMNKGRVNRE